MQCITGRVREFWEQNGGLPIFGYPTSDQHEERVEGKPFQVQRFERARLELHPENAQPYDVLLGRLGEDRLLQQRRDWFTFPKADPGAPHYFAETGHAIASQFWGYWSSHGLEFDGRRGTSFAESLALLGLPLSEPEMERSVTDGRTYLTQHFERARFELHPENAPPYNILLGLLGNEIRAASTVPTAYRFVNFDYPGSVWTTLSAINNVGQVVGDYSTESLAAGKPVRSFVRSLDGERITERGTDFVAPGSENTSPLGINDAGQVVGYYYDADGGGHGFVRSADGERFESIDHPQGVVETAAFGINKAGQISGFYIDRDQGVHGFVRSADGESFTEFDNPDATVGQTYAKAIDDTGRVVGHHRNEFGVHAFVRSPDGKSFENFDHPLADGGTCGQFINPLDEVAGFYYTDGGKVVHGFVRSADGKTFNTIDHPQGVGGTMVFGMNDAGQVVGYYTDASGNYHGFIATPVR